MNIRREVLPKSVRKRYIGGTKVKRVYVGDQLMLDEESKVVITKPGGLYIRLDEIGIATEGDMD